MDIVQAWVFGKHVLPLGFGNSLSLDGRVLVQEGPDWFIISRADFDREYEWVTSE